MNDQTLQKVLSQALVTNNKILLTQMKEYTDQALDDQSRSLRDYTDQRIIASENRITQQVTQHITRHVDERFDGQKQEIIDAMAETMDYFIHPRINDHERRLLKLEAKAA